MKTDTYLQVRFSCSSFSLDLIIFTVDLPVVGIQKYRGWERRKLTQILSPPGGQIWNSMLSCQRPVNPHIIIVADILHFQLEGDKKLTPLLRPKPLQDKIIQFQVWFKLTSLKLHQRRHRVHAANLNVAFLLVLQSSPLCTQSTRTSTTFMAS